MARVSAKLWKLAMLQLLQFVQDLITAATGNPNAPTPNPHIATLQGLYDEGVIKNNAYTAAKAALDAAEAARDEQARLIILGLTSYGGAMETHTAYDGVKLQSLSLPLRSPRTPPVPCGTIMGLVTRVGDDEGTMFGRWDAEDRALTYEVQTSPDPITPSSWVYGDASAPRNSVKVTGLPSGQKRWMRVRGCNKAGKGSWSDPSCRMIP